MSSNPVVYIAGIGMITPVGVNSEMTSAAVKAGISAYSISEFYDQNDDPITMASIPDGMLSNLKFDMDEGDRYNDRHDRVSKMAIFALSQACEKIGSPQSIPLMLTMPENQEDEDGLTPIIDHLEKNCQSWVNKKKYKCIFGDRSAGIEAIHSSFQYLQDLANNYILIGGSDSYRDYSRLGPHIKAERLLTSKSMDSFAPGEAACFLLLTGKRELALERDGYIIALHTPGIAEEPGYYGSDEPYLGEGLDQAFKKSLKNIGPSKIQTIFSSMNGESHWAKEYGVAYMRNQILFEEDLITQHPAESYGDVGVATSPALIALAAEHLYNNPKVFLNQVYSSSDTAKRAAVVIEKLSVLERS